MSRKIKLLFIISFNILFGYCALGQITYVSSTVEQGPTTNVQLNSRNNEIIRVKIECTGSGTPLNIMRLTLGSQGTAYDDFYYVRIFYTGTSSALDTNNQFGNAFYNPQSPSFSVSGDQDLVSGTNYFWITYDIPANATPGNAVDASCDVIWLGATTTVSPTEPNPVGNRTIEGPGSNEDIISEQNISLFPNPANENAQLSFELNDEEYISVKVYDLQGKLVLTAFEGVLNKGAHKINLELNSLEPATYIYHIEAKDKVFTGKIHKA